jgi:hypothetical protein
MKRRVFSVLAGVSMLLCVAVVVLWVRSYERRDELLIFLPQTGTSEILSIRSYAGDIDFELNRLPGCGFGFTWQLISEPISSAERSTFGKQWHWIFRLGGLDSRILFPAWLPGALLLVIPTRRALARRKTRPGLCPTCGYDLRATPQRCPECGIVPPATRTPTAK